MNIILKPFNCCPHCYSDVFKRDFKRHELYCAECGLILVDSVPFSISEYMRHKEIENRQLNHLKQHKELKPIIEHYQRQKRQY